MDGERRSEGNKTRLQLYEWRNLEGQRKLTSGLGSIIIWSDAEECLEVFPAVLVRSRGAGLRRVDECLHVRKPTRDVLSVASAFSSASFNLEDVGYCTMSDGDERVYNKENICQSSDG